MAAKKYYAVKSGRKTGIFSDWEACREAVEGYPGAEFKGFLRLEDAEEYLGRKAYAVGGKSSGAGEHICESQATAGTQEIANPESKASAGSWNKSKAEKIRRTARQKPEKAEGAEGFGSKEQHAEQDQESGLDQEAGLDQEIAAPKDRPESGTLLAYVDGSYDHSLRKYAFGCVFILPDGRVKTQYGNGDNAQSLQQRNVTGEMLGAMYAVRTAMVSGFSKIEIRYDYEGIEKWVTGAWRSKTDLTQKYARSMRQWGESIVICFTKVAAHSNVYYNEKADKTAKAGLREGNGVPKVCPVEEL